MVVNSSVECRDVQLNIVAGKRNEIAWKQGNETEPIAACAVIGFFAGFS